MYLTTPEDEQDLTALLAAIVAAFLVATGIAFAIDHLWDRDTREPVAHRGRRTNPRVEPDEPDIAQAPWRMVAFPASTPGHATKKQKAAVKRAAPGVKDAVQDLYDALTVSRSKFDDVSSRLMPERARNALHGRAIVPFSLSRIKTTKREARIAIDLQTRSAASAHVELAFRAEQGRKRVSFMHDGTLWLQRTKKGWQIIAFDLDQRKTT